MGAVPGGIWGERINLTCKVALESAWHWWFNRKRRLKITIRNKQQINLRLRLLSESKLVISLEGQRLKHAQTGRAESVLPRHTSA